MESEDEFEAEDGNPEEEKTQEKSQTKSEVPDQVLVLPLYSQLSPER